MSGMETKRQSWLLLKHPSIMTQRCRMRMKFIAYACAWSSVVAHGIPEQHELAWVISGAGWCLSLFLLSSLLSLIMHRLPSLLLRRRGFSPFLPRFFSSEVPQSPSRFAITRFLFFLFFSLLSFLFFLL